MKGYMLQPTDPLTAFLEAFTIWWQMWGWRILPIIGLLIGWAILIVAYGVVRRYLKRRARKAGVPPDAINGLNLAVGFGLLYIGFVLFVFVLPDIFYNLTAIIGASSLIIGAAIGLSIGQAVKNFVSGLYVIFSRPFHVEDYVRIGNVEGVVKEISMNYTKLLQPDGSDKLVPNNVVLDSDVTNFMYEKQKLESLLEHVEHIDDSRIKTLSKAIKFEKVVRYVFSMAFHTTQDLRKLRASFNQICKRWEKKLEFRPLYEISDVNQFSFTYTFVLYSDSARKILEYKPAFMDDILNAIFLHENE
jgi:small-conductance mechanosensitive channel